MTNDTPRKVHETLSAMRKSGTNAERNLAERLMQDLQLIVDAYGWNAAGPWQLVRTRFHGGGIVSSHRSLLRALKAVGSIRTDCTCGCVGIHLATNDLPGTEANDANGYSPYALTR